MHIILDLDQTLISTEGNILPYPPQDVQLIQHLHQPHINTNNIHAMKYFNISKNSYDTVATTGTAVDTSVVYTRPYLAFYLNYLYKHHKVSIWTAGRLDYCLHILKRILTNDQMLKTRYIIARDNYNFKGVTGKYAFYSGFKPDPENIIIPFVFDKERNLIKKLDLKTTKMNHNKFYKIFYKSTNHILIDDNPKIYNENNKFDINKKQQMCVYNIKGFYPNIDNFVNVNSFKDNELIKCINILENHKNVNNTNNKKFKTVKTNLNKNIYSKKVKQMLKRNHSYNVSLYRDKFFKNKKKKNIQILKKGKSV